MVRNVVFITDKNYLLPTRVAIKSLINFCKLNHEYNIYCIVKGLDDADKQLIKLLGKNNVKVCLLDSKDFPIYASDIKLEEHHCSANITALIKFDLPVIFKDIDKILYLDGDIIINQDIDDIFLIDLEENYVAAVQDAGGMYTREVQKRMIKKAHFNSGVMLLNLKKMREDRIRDKLYKKKLSSNDTFLMDQSTFNEVLHDKVKLLPIEYNCMYVSIINAKYFRGLKLDQINSFYESSFLSWKAILQSAKIIHYTTAVKPWKYSDVTAVEFWDKIYQSMGEDIILNRKKIYMKKLYYMCRYKYLRPLAILIWEWRGLGAKKTIFDIKRVLNDYKYNLKKIFSENCK